ncbi:hypothetical protein DFH06DRAFT_1334342 [Mycena polygramma]|nr:hypothetical protein DFH06DRAFT_1334342 [Mycena polygramma]
MNVAFSAPLDPLAVPFDVWSSVFIWVLMPQRSTVIPFVTMRRKLCSVCRFWNTVVCGNAAFWTIVGTLPLDAVLRLEAEATLPSRVFWTTFTPAIPRCRTLVIHVLDTVQLDPVVLGLQQNMFAGTRSLTIRTDSMSSHELRELSVSLRVNGPLPNLSVLQLHGISFDWTSRSLCNSLSTLVLINSTSPLSWDDVRSLAANAVALQFFCLRNVGCYGIPDVVQDPITWPSVVEFDCALGEYAPSATLMLRYSCMPSLSVLRFNAREPGHVMCLAFCSTVISTVKTLVISGVPDRSFSYLLFIRLPHLEELDIISHDANVLDGILEADQRLSRILTPFRPCCPMLSTLHVSGPSAAEVRDFLACRDIYAPTIREVVFRQSSAYLPSGDDLAALRDRVAIGFTGAYSDPPWISHV